MDILLDSNVIIELEGPERILPESIADMVRLSQELGYRMNTHPCQVDDLKRDKNETRKQIQLSKLRQYPTLENPPVPSGFELMEYGWSQKNDHDRCDNLLLFAVKRSAVRILVTEDRKMHAKARRAGIGEQVYFVEELLSRLRDEYARKLLTSTCAKIETKYLYEIDVRQPFFNSLRASYSGFNDWFNRCASEKRRAWVIEDDGNLSALCVFKEEKDEIVTDTNDCLYGRSLKLCTFKVADLGKKLGERLLFVSFKMAVENDFDYVYLQVREEGQGFLLNLLQDYGFVRLGEYHDDITYVKDMRRGVYNEGLSESERLEYDVRYYPHFLFGPEVKKYVVPIRPDFHDKLFPDLKHQPEFFDDVNGFDSEANAIKKAYICRSSIKTLQPGDLLFFYRSHQGKTIRCIGFVEETKRSSVADDIDSFVSKRTVYSHREIEEIVRGGETIAILFRVVCYLGKPITESEIRSSSMPWPIQSICGIPEESFAKLQENRKESFV